MMTTTMNMQKQNTALYTLEAPCDLYGINARRFHEAVTSTDGILKIEKPAEDKACSAVSLLGLLGLGVKKGDQIRIIAEGHVKDVPNLFDAIPVQ